MTERWMRPWVWFGTGVVAGVIGCLAVVLALRIDGDGEEDVRASESPTTGSAATAGGSTDPVVTEPADTIGLPGVPDLDATDVSVAAPVTCPAATVTVGDADELQEALDAARPGDTIALADGTYEGAFVATVSGSEAAPIHLCGGNGAVLDGGGISKGYVLHLQQVAYWRVVGFTVRNGQKGVVADGTSHSVIQGLTVEDIGDEAIHLRSASTDNVVRENTIRRTGLRRDKFGEGVYVGSATSNWEKYSEGGPDRSDRNVVVGNTISDTGSEPIDIKEGTTGGLVVGNVMDGAGMTGADSLIDVKGNGWIVEGNIGANAEEGIQTHRILDGWGTDNVIRGNTLDVSGNGNHVYVHDPEVTANVVACDNRTSAGEAIRSNVECSG